MDDHQNTITYRKNKILLFIQSIYSRYVTMVYKYIISITTKHIGLYRALRKTLAEANSESAHPKVASAELDFDLDFFFVKHYNK